MEKKAETVLKFVPKSYPLSFSELSERIHRFAPEIQDHELTNIVEELVREGLVYEPQPGEYQKVAVEVKKPEEEKPEEKKHYLNLQGNIRFTKTGNIEVKVYLPINYIKKMLGVE